MVWGAYFALVLMVRLGFTLTAIHEALLVKASYTEQRSPRIPLNLAFLINQRA